MPKVLMATTIERTLRDFILPYGRHFSSLGWQTHCISNTTDHYEGCAENFHHVHHINWTRNPFDPTNYNHPVKQIQQLATDQKYDIIHVHTPVAAFVTRYALRNLRKNLNTKIVYTAHGFHFYKGNNPLKNLTYKTVEKIAANWTDHLIVMNHEDHQAAQNFLLPPNQITYMPGIGLDVPYYAPTPTLQKQADDFRQTLGLQPHQKLLIMVAEFNPGKRHSDLVQALHNLQNPDVHLAFLGEKGPMLSHIKDLTDSLGLTPQIHFCGFQKDPRAPIIASDCLILPSEREGLPRCIMESMSLGTPVIGTDIRGTKDLLSQGAGLLYPTGNPQALANAIDQILKDPKLHHQIKTTATQKIQTYALLPLLKQHEELYHNLINKKTTGS